MFREHFAQFERDVARLTPDDIRELAAAYRQWRDVLAAPLDSVDQRSIRALGPVNRRVREAIEIAARGEVGDVDLEDAIMAAWLSLLAATDRRERPVVAILAGPWRQAQRLSRARQHEPGPAPSRIQLDRTTFPVPA